MVSNKIKKHFSIIILCLSAVLGLAGCSKKQSVEVVEVKYPNEDENENLLKGIFEYEFESSWSDVNNDLFQALLSYDVTHKLMTREYWEMLNVVQTGINEQGEVWINLQEDGKLTNRSLDMMYGFYDEHFKNLNNYSDWRIWTSPNGVKRIIRTIDKDTGHISLIWQEKSGRATYIARDLDIGQCDVMCVWSGDSQRAFVRILPNTIFLEKEMTEWQVSTRGKYKLNVKNESILFDELGYGDIWLIEKDRSVLRAAQVYEAKADDTLKSGMVASYDGTKLLMYMGDGYEAVLRAKETKSRHTATYISQNDDGNWADNTILHFNSKVNYTNIAFYEDKVVAITDDGILSYWDPVTGEKISSEEVIKGEYDMCIFTTHSNGRFIYTATDSDIIQYMYNEDTGRWIKKILYKSPQNTSILSMQYSMKNDGLLLLYMVDDNIRNTQRYETVFLQLFTIEN